MADSLVSAVLTPQQQDAVEFYRSLNVPASWFIGEPGVDGRVEVIALGREPETTFLWSLIVDPDGQTASSEARVGDFVTGIDV